MTSTVTLITGEGSVRVYGDNLVLDLREGSVDALLDTPTNSPEGVTRRLDDLGSVQDGLKMSSDGRAVERRISEGSLRNDAEDAGVTAGETATELCFPNGSVSADERSNPSLISGWSDLVEAGTGQTRAVLPQEPSKANDGRNVEASGEAAFVITHSETPAGILPNPRQADSAGEAIPPTSPALLSTGATVAKTGCDRIPTSAPVANSSKKLRPHCRRPELCGSGTRDHCHACKLAMGESEVAA